MMTFTFAGYAQEDTKVLTLDDENKLIKAEIYHENGELSQTGYYTLDGKLHGEWFSYCDQGNKLVSAVYENGKKVGKWFYWNGDNLHEVDYQQNIIASSTTWNKDVYVKN